jgi:predicted  nucleic acid-binding Zn-ribbon protein
MQQHKMEHPDIKRLEVKLEECDTNVITFENAITKERGTIKEWQGFMDNPNSGFSNESLESGIDKCKKNIVTFEEAISKEYSCKKEIRFMIDKIREKGHIEELQKNGITIDAKDID